MSLLTIVSGAWGEIVQASSFSCACVSCCCCCCGRSTAIHRVHKECLCLNQQGIPDVAGLLPPELLASVQIM